MSTLATCWSCEILQKGSTCAGFLHRAARWFRDEHGITIRRVLTDNAKNYVLARSFQQLLADHSIRHVRIKPYCPRTNGKVERFHQTMAREWAYGLVYRSHEERARALPHWLEHYNQERPHSSLGDRPPISRVHNVPDQDS